MENGIAGRRLCQYRLVQSTRLSNAIISGRAQYDEYLSAADVGFYGITAPQILAFLLTIAASFLSARWGSTEYRKQFARKTQDDERAAAAALIPILSNFATNCDTMKSNLSLSISSQRQEGRDENLADLTFDPAVHTHASRLGPAITQRAIKLEMTLARAKTYLSKAYDHLDSGDVDQQMLSFLALLSLRARHLIDMAANQTGMTMRYPRSDMERLLKLATKHSHEIDSGDEGSWS
ncbi:hypothetical protein ACVI1L_004448 [Bradyrhizobium sp. USDA 4516]